MSPNHELKQGIDALPILWRGVLLVGLPTVLCLLLIGKDMAVQFGWVTDMPAQRFNVLVQSHTSLHSLTQQNNRLLAQNQNLLAGTNRVMLALCLNSANNPTDRDRCIQAGK